MCVNTVSRKVTNSQYFHIKVLNLIVFKLPSTTYEVCVPSWRARSHPCALNRLRWACIGSQWWYLSGSRSGRSRLCGTPEFFSETPPSASGSWAPNSPSAYVNLQHTQKVGEYINEIVGYWVLQKLPKIYCTKKKAPPLLFGLYGQRQGRWGTTLTLKYYNLKDTSLGIAFEIRFFLSLKLKIWLEDRVLLFNDIPGL